MDVSARDINNKEFLLAFRGYNQDEVDDFLDQLAETMDRLERENETLRKRLKGLEETAQTAKGTEEMLKKTLMSAQQTAQQTIAEARAQAEQLVAEAEQRARRADEEVRQRVAAAEEETRRKIEELQSRFEERKGELDSSVGRLEVFETEIKRRLQSFMEQQLQALDTLHEKKARAPEPMPQPTPQAVEEPPVAEEDDREQEVEQHVEEDEGPSDEAPSEGIFDVEGQIAAASNPEQTAEVEVVEEETQDEQDDGDRELIEELAGPSEDDSSLFAELAADQIKDDKDEPLDDFKPFDDDAALQGRRRRGLFRRRVDDWA